MFKDDNTPTKQMIPIGAPRQDEVNNLFNYWRLKYELPVDWRIFPTAAAAISRYLCSQGRTLKSVIPDLRKLKSLNKDALSELAGQTETGSALERLHQMSGLEAVAKRIEEIVTYHQEQISSNSASLNQTHTTVARLLPSPSSPAKGCNLHLALKGNPGTGKTTVARLIGEIYRQAGLLEMGHFVKVTETDLVAGFVGQTVLKTAQKIADAMGGILFIDEAYSLTNSQFGEQAVTTLLEAMSDRMGEFAVIIAGYPKEIDDFLNINPGLPSRFDSENTVIIPDYDPKTLQLIFEQQVSKQKRQLDNNLQTKLAEFLAHWHADRDEKTFGNARDVLNLYQKNGSTSCNSCPKSIG
jgi:SpoVK/Ycf46/Vps4 family AAA+-type ATPase